MYNRYYQYFTLEKVYNYVFSKRLVLLFVILLRLSIPVTAQIEDTEKLGFGFNVRGIGYQGLFLSTIFTKKNISFGFRFGVFSKDAQNVPANYHSAITIFGNHFKPKIRLQAMEVLAGWRIPIKPDNKAFILFRTGAGYNHFVIPENFEYHSGGLIFGSFYSYDRTHLINTGWIISGELDFDLTNHIQLYFAPEFNINSYENLQYLNFGIRFNADVAILSSKKQ